jgi:hypothetical protein
VVRRDINPNFFATEGKFIITYMSGLTVNALLLEYNEEEKNSMPQKFIDFINSTKKNPLYR